MVLQCSRFFTVSRVRSASCLLNITLFNPYTKASKHRPFIKSEFTRSFSLSKRVFADHENSTVATGLVNFVHPQERTIFVGNLDPSSTEKSVEDYFSLFGVVERVTLKASTKKYNLASYAFVQFKDLSSVDKIFSSKKKHVIDLRNVNVKKYKSSDPRKICVSYIPLELNASHLKEHFSQFGTVDSVEFVANNPLVEREGYCFVEFATSSAVLKALESPLQQIGEYSVEVKEFTARNKSYIKGKAIINEIPDNMTVEILREHFSQFGDLSFVDLVFYHSNGKRRDFAFLGFSDDQTVEKVTGKNGRHVINSQEIIVKRALSDSKNQDRDLKLFVDNIPITATEDQVSIYFKAFGNATLLTQWKREEHIQSCIAMFRTVAEVDRVLAQPSHAFRGEKLIVKRIGWTAPPQDTQLKELLSIL